MYVYHTNTNKPCTCIVLFIDNVSNFDMAAQLYIPSSFFVTLVSFKMVYVSLVLIMSSESVRPCLIQRNDAIGVPLDKILQARVTLDPTATL